MSIAVNGLSGLDSYLGTSAASGVSGEGLSNRIGSIGSESAADELKEVCKDFESYFMEQVYKEMSKSVKMTEEGDTPLSNLVDYFKDTAVQMIAAQTTEQTGGPLAQQLYEQMKRNYGIEEES